MPVVAMDRGYIVAPAAAHPFAGATTRQYDKLVEMIRGYEPGPDLYARVSLRYSAEGTHDQSLVLGVAACAGARGRTRWGRSRRSPPTSEFHANVLVAAPAVPAVPLKKPVKCGLAQPFCVVWSIVVAVPNEIMPQLYRLRRLGHCT